MYNISPGCKKPWLKRILSINKQTIIHIHTHTQCTHAQCTHTQSTHPHPHTHIHIHINV